MEGYSSDPGRKSLPHLPSRDFVNQSIIQYVTVDVAKKRPILANPAAVRVILDAWRAADFWLVGRYVLMPDHLHLFCAPGIFPPTSLKQYVDYWRSEATRHWPVLKQKPIWQKDFFDRQLRSRESYREKWDYVLHNPVRAGLVTRPEDWPFQGELNILQWHEP